MVKKLDPPPNRIREVRKKRGLTLRQVAEQLGTSQTQVGRFETGERQIDLPWLRRIAQVLETNPGQLLSGDDNPFSLSDEKARVIKAMRCGKPCVAAVIAQVANSLIEHVESV